MCSASSGCVKIIAAYLFIAFCVVCRAEWNANEYIKREHSLVKPYQGEITKYDLTIFSDIM